MNILIINGPNLNLLGKREPEIYGNQSFESYFKTLEKKFSSHNLTFFQSNTEGNIIDKIHEADKNSDGIVLNAAAYTHTSIAIADAIRSIDTPVLEVHLSNIYARESFREKSYTASACLGAISGLGLYGYEAAIKYFTEKV